MVSLWQSGGSGGLHAMRPTVIEHIWKIERILVDAHLCPAADEEVQKLRRQTWPRAHAGKAPQVSKVIYINLAWDRARRQYMEDQLQVMGQLWQSQFRDFQWERLDAVEATALQHEDRFAHWREKGFSRSNIPDVQGDWSTAACAYSHYSAISRIDEGPGSRLVLITEDDVAIHPKFLQMWEEVWPYVPEEWDVLRVGWFGDHQNCSQVINPRADRAGWQALKNGECAYCGAQAYIVNPRSKQRLLKRFEHSKITHADVLLGALTPLSEDPKSVPPIRAYVIWPMLATIRYNEKGHPYFGSDRIGAASDRLIEPVIPGTTK